MPLSGQLVNRSRVFYIHLRLGRMVLWKSCFQQAEQRQCIRPKPELYLSRNAVTTIVGINIA